MQFGMARNLPTLFLWANCVVVGAPSGQFLRIEQPLAASWEQRVREHDCYLDLLRPEIFPSTSPQRKTVQAKTTGELLADHDEHPHRDRKAQFADSQ
jgi:hypothetical protein